MTRPKGYKLSEKTKENIRNSNIGKHNISEETRENLRKSHLGQTAWNKGKKGLQIAWNKDTKGIMKSNKTSFKKGMIPWNKNKITEIKPWFGKKRSEADKKKMSISTIKYIKRNGLTFKTRIGRYEKQILDNLEECFNYNILRQHQVDRYFLDGYCPQLNCAIEIDEKMHRKNIHYDIIRENKIKSIIGCTFLRIDIGEVV